MDKTNQRIKDLREDNDLTQSELAKILNTSQRRISYMEKGITQPTLEDIRLIYDYFNVDIFWLLAIPKNPRQNNEDY